MNPIAYLNHAAAANLFDSATVYTKKETTALRRVSPAEIGATLITYKASAEDARGYTQESEAVLTEDHIIARNTARLLGTDETGQSVYNTWPIPTATIIKNYGDAVLASLTGEFQEHRKKATLRAVPLTAALLEAFGAAPGEPLAITVSWSDKPMFAHEGDFITDQSYSVSKADMTGYVPV